MNSRDYKFSLIISLWCIVFIGASEKDLAESIEIFNTGWLDLLKAVVVGFIIGLIFRKNKVQNYLESLPLGKLTTGTFLGIVGLGFIGVGVMGAIIIYAKFGNIEYVRLPLHAALVGLATYLIYITMHWSKRDI